MLKWFWHWKEQIDPNIMSEQTEKQNKYVSASITTVVVILLLLLFWYVTIDYDIPQLPKETLVEIEIIEPESGGSGSPGSTTPEETSIPQMSLPAPSTEQTNDQTATSVKKTSTTPVKTPDPNSQEENITDKYKGGKPTNNSSSNQPDFGNGSGGSGGGTNGGNGNKPGSGDGNGFSHSFGKRPIRAANITHDCGIKGKIILEVSVAPDGRITILDTDPGSSQSDCLERYAKKFVNGSKFDKVDATSNATGTITINFDLN